jgi:hypothetical protein
MYRNRHWIKPTTPPLHMTFADADVVPGYYELREPMTFTAGPYKSTIDPRHLEYGVLQRADALVLRIIQDSWNDRPIYFARSSVGYPRSLGLENNMLTQGLASKLFLPPASSSKDTLFVQGDGWLDVTRTKALWNDVFQGPKSVVAEGRWVDRASVSMPSLYIFAGAELAEALRNAGDNAGANAVFVTTRGVASATRLDEMIRAIDQEYRAPTTGDSSGVSLRVDPATQLKTQSTEPAGKKPKP